MNEMKSLPGMRTVAVIGAGLIGCSWAALFAAKGLNVRLYDPRPDAERIMQDFWNSVRPALQELGPDDTLPVEPRIEIAPTAADAIRGVDFVQECIPERLEMKQALYLEIEPHLEARAIVATSSSGLRLSDLQALWTDPARLIIAHPFNPPHIIPLVELYANDRTAPDALPIARALFEGCGKVTITLRKEVMAHVANRLQAALWREAIHLVCAGVASVEDVDKAIWSGPGLRWAVMGPHMLLNLGGGPAGLRAYCEQFADSYATWWADLGEPVLTPETVESLVKGLRDEIGDRSYPTLRAERDTKLIAVLRALREADAARPPMSVPA